MRQEFPPGPALGSQQRAPQLTQPQEMAGDVRSLAHPRSLSFGTSTELSLRCGWFCMCKVRPGRNVRVIQSALSWSGQQASPSCSVLHFTQAGPACCVVSTPVPGSSWWHVAVLVSAPSFCPSASSQYAHCLCRRWSLSRAVGDISA